MGQQQSRQQSPVKSKKLLKALSKARTELPLWATNDEDLAVDRNATRYLMLDQDHLLLSLFTKAADPDTSVALVLAMGRLLSLVEVERLAHPSLATPSGSDRRWTVKCRSFICRFPSKVTIDEASATAAFQPLRSSNMITATDLSSNTALLALGLFGNLPLITCLLHRDWSAQVVPVILHGAARGGHYHILVHLLREGVPALAGDEKAALLHAAAGGNCWRSFRLALSVCEDIMTPYGPAGEVVLQTAVRLEAVKVALGLLNPKEKSSKKLLAASSPALLLKTAASFSQRQALPLVRMLLAADVEPQVDTLLDATYANSPLVVELLLMRMIQLGRNPMKPCDHRGITFLHAATEIGSLEIIALAIKQCGKQALEVPDQDGNCPLHIAAKGKPAVCRYLLEAGANPNVVVGPIGGQLRGMTPLHYAAQIGSVVNVQDLLAYGANPNALTFLGRTPRNLARNSGAQSVVSLLGPQSTIQRIR